jgi:hypothetical protein
VIVVVLCSCSAERRRRRNRHRRQRRLQPDQHGWFERDGGPSGRAARGGDVRRLDDIQGFWASDGASAATTRMPPSCSSATPSPPAAAATHRRPSGPSTAPATRRLHRPLPSSSSCRASSVPRRLRAGVRARP